MIGVGILGIIEPEITVPGLIQANEGLVQGCRPIAVSNANDQAQPLQLRQRVAHLEVHLQPPSTFQVLLDGPVDLLGRPTFLRGLRKR